MKLLLIASAVALCALRANAGEIVPAGDESAVIAPPYVHFMSRGTPADSFALRISLCNEVYQFSESHSWLIVDEFEWPVPIPGLDFDPAMQAFTQRVLEPNEYVRSTVEIDGDFFHDRAFAIIESEPCTGGVRYRAGELYVRGTQQPLEFVAWHSPVEFVVRYSSVDFVLQRVGGGRYELLDVQRVCSE